MATRRLTLDIKDIPGLRRALTDATSQIMTSVRDQMPEVGAQLMQAANAEGHAPQGTGTMLGTSIVAPPVGGNRKAVIAAGYTHELAPAVHEGFHGGVKRSKSKTPTRGWFTRALYAFEPQFRSFLEKALRNAMGGS